MLAEKPQNNRKKQKQKNKLLNPRAEAMKAMKAMWLG